jgi:DNA-binding transcriptional ArsR family regulator
VLVPRVTQAPTLTWDCATWNVPKATPDPHQVVTSDVPALILEGTIDAITPPENGKAVQPGLSRSQYVEVPGSGHDTPALAGGVHGAADERLPLGPHRRGRHERREGTERPAVHDVVNGSLAALVSRRPYPEGVRAPQVEIAGGDGYDLLVSAVAVADGDWRAVLAHGPEVVSAVRREAGAEVARGVTRLGRFGWINLIGLLAAEGRRRGGRADLAALVARTPARELRFVVAGGMRRQLRDRLGAERLADALTGDASARRELNRALAPPRMLVDVTAWVRRASDDELKAVVERSIAAWPKTLPVATEASAARRARERLREIGPGALLQEVTPGIRYGPAVLDRVVLVGSALVEPILISVDQPDLTVIVHPPLGADGMADAARALREQGNAVGDEVRVLVLHELRAGPRTLADLCAALTRPRTTLLHHLALLRAAGFVTLTVTAGEPNVYRLDVTGFDRLARAARGFVLP